MTIPVLCASAKPMEANKAELMGGGPDKAWVVGTLDFARELTGQSTKLASDDAKDRKKQAKREQQEKARQELAKV